MLDTAAVARGKDIGVGGSSSGSGGMQKSALAAMFRGPDAGVGLAAFDRKGELVRAEGAVARPGGILDIAGFGPHVQIGDVDFQVSLLFPQDFHRSGGFSVFRGASRVGSGHEVF